jgi:DNA-binding PadR family transcriptional regulator
MSEALKLNAEEPKKKVTVEIDADLLPRLERLLQMQEEEELEKQRQEQAQKNSDFVQLYRENMPELRWLMSNHNFPTALLFFMIEHMDNRNALACSYAVFEDYFGKARMTIYRALKVLEENGFIDVLKMGTSNVYLVNQEFAWTDRKDMKKFAKYDGKILVSRKENKDYQYRSQFDRFKALREREGIKK